MILMPSPGLHSQGKPLMIFGKYVPFGTLKRWMIYISKFIYQRMILKMFLAIKRSVRTTAVAVPALENRKEMGGGGF